MVNEVQKLNENQDNLFKGLGVEIVLRSPDDFLKVKETLERIGVTSKTHNTLYQSCHILHKRQRFVIIHFKEMFILDGKPADVSDIDVGRRNTICNLLQQWGLVDIINKDDVSNCVPVSTIKILPHSQRNNWTLKSKYSIGRK